jgi:hypothetical protein
MIGILAQADPSSASLQRDLIVDYVKLNEVRRDRAYVQRALETALAMQSRCQLARSDGWMIEDLQRRAGQTQ